MRRREKRRKELVEKENLIEKVEEVEVTEEVKEEINLDDMAMKDIVINISLYLNKVYKRFSVSDLTPTMQEVLKRHKLVKRQENYILKEMSKALLYAKFKDLHMTIQILVPKDEIKEVKQEEPKEELEVEEKEEKALYISNLPEEVDEEARTKREFAVDGISHELNLSGTIFDDVMYVGDNNEEDKQPEEKEDEVEIHEYSNPFEDDDEEVVISIDEKKNTIEIDHHIDSDDDLENVIGKKIDDLEVFPKSIEKGLLAKEEDNEPDGDDLTLDLPTKEETIEPDEEIETKEKEAKKKNFTWLKILIPVIVLIIIIILLLKGCAKEEKFTVSFDTGGNVETVKIVKDKAVPQPEEPKKEGYRFAGWYHNNTKYDFSEKITEDITLEARWEEIEPESLTVIPSEITIKIGSETTLEAIIDPSDALNKDVIWESTNPSVVTVEDGVIKGLKKGTATIIVKTADESLASECLVKVDEMVYEVTGITFTKESDTILVGNPYQIEYKVEPNNASNKTVKWESSNKNIATVDSRGIVTGKKEGNVTITATTVDGGYSAKIELKVSNAHAESVSLDKTKATIKYYESVKLTATVKPSYAVNKKVKWESSKPTVATVDANGKITAMAPGETTITVTTEDGNKKATAKITVQDVHPSSVSLSRNKLEIIVGNEEELSATVKPDDARNKKVKWESSKPDIATVDANGKVKALKEGTTTIKVTTEDGKKEASIEVTVKRIPVTGVTLEKDTSLDIDKTTTLKATISPANATEKGLSWQSSNTDVAKVDQNGVVTAVSTGTAKITVTTKDGEKTASVTITVKSVAINIGTDKTLYYGDSLSLTTGNIPNICSVAWTSSKESVATVNANGKVTPASKGETKIKAKLSQNCGGTESEIKVTVKNRISIEFKLRPGFTGNEKYPYQVKTVKIKNEKYTFKYADILKLNGNELSMYTNSSESELSNWPKDACTASKYEYVKLNNKKYTDIDIKCP